MKKKESMFSVVKEIRDMLKLIIKMSVSPLPSVDVKEKKNNRFVKNEDGTVLDKSTGLIWGKTFDKSMPWADAIKACKELSLGGHKDWRLPTVNELFSLVDRKKYKPAIDTEFFPDTKSDWYWTSEELADDSGFAWIVVFGYGFVGYGDKTGYNYVRPVRSGQRLIF